MKTLNKFSILLLLMAAVLLSSYALKHKGSTNLPKAIITPAAAEARIGTQKSEPVTKVKIDSTIKTHIASCACGQLTVTVVGPDPERRSICFCHLCQKQSGSAFAIQARFPKEEVTIKGKATAWKFPPKTVTGRTCADGGGTFYFCPVCGSTVYYTVDADPARIGVKVGTFADSTFPAPIISGFEEYAHPWVMNIAALSMPLGHHE